MNLDYLKTYIEILRLGSFSEAAKKLNLSQPAISFQVHKLERDLGVRLIDRGQKPVTPTEAGRLLLRFAESVERERSLLVQELDRVREQVTGNLNIIASTIPGEILLPRILHEFTLIHPSTGASVEISDSATVISNVQDGTFDIGFAGIAPDGRDLDSFKIGEDEIVLIVPPGHPLAGKDAVSVMDLAGENFICRSETSGTRQSLDAILSRAGASAGKLTSNLILGTTQAVVSAVEAGVGISFVSSLAIAKSLQLDLVKTVPVREIDLRRDFFCLYREERVVSRLLSEFIAFLRARSSQA
ncbi:MAG: LysR family transcriptional regulator [Dehalococcoidia bacterium]|nr:LysR family transcriptional regulator [Dehalococcoidia bacterium]